MKIKGFFKDITGIFRVIKARQEAIKKADGSEIPEDRITYLAKQMHPGKIKATVIDIIQETKDSKRIVFSSKDMPFFKAGNYLTIEMQIGNSIVTRAYSIVSSPLKAYKEKIAEIIVKDTKDGFVAPYINNELKVGDEVLLEVGLGQFNYEKYRDKKNIVAIAGGVGITPFISMAHDIIERRLDINLTIIYGSVNPNEIIAKDEIESLMQDNIKVVHVISGNYKYSGEKGFITKEIIKKYSHKECSYFICGPKVMFDSVIGELKELNVDLRRIRYETFPISDISVHKDFPKEFTDKEVVITVHQGTHVSRIPAKCCESIATALERSGLRIHTACRGGQCGVCRIKVIEGEFFIPKENDHRREADKEFNYVHSCSTYPLTDLTIKINIA